MSKNSSLNISRRDFINGCALGIAAGATLSPMELLADRTVAQTAGPYYPPSLTGLRGNHAGAFEVAHSVAWQGKKWRRPKHQTDELYDLVVVGGGISGLAAAYYYQQEQSQTARVLVLENHDDFGGHAKRNEFNVGGKTIIGYGGSQSIDGPASYSKEASALLKSLAIDTQRFYKYFDDDFYSRWKLDGALYFDKRKFSQDRLIADPFRDYSDEPNADHSATIRKFPISQKAQEELIGLLTAPKDPFKNLSPSEKRNKLRSLSYIDYLQQHLRFSKETADLLRDRSVGFWGVGWDALSTLEAARMSMPGMEPFAELIESEYQAEDDEPYIFHFPDGNAGITRALIRQLIPQAVPGNTMEDLVTARADYGLLDQASSPTRIRLNSTAVDVRHTTDESKVDVTYVTGGQVHRVRAKHVVMACYNNIIPHICPELPTTQREAIAYATKVPLVYTNIALRNWRSFAELGMDHLTIPKADLHQTMSLDYPVSMGGYEFAKNPDEPILVHATYAPTVPDQGLSAREQHRLGRHKLYQLTFAEFEQSLLNQLDGALGRAGFDVERDVAGITVNRWPHGYAYEYNDYSDPVNWGPDNGPHIQGRAQIGRISIANSDASAYAYVNGAIDAAHRAVSEQLGRMT
ncbi:FAD-dependent oxidoreductase [Pseudomaricurvus alkylphenolicus]|uniref:FAD-dependent oxidoreductase n=1 Tax=Pseudomaricurvus alkylphenolicus TaxID=1306991 RepID=UPI00141EF6C3|nr:NAD(P)/FAD-dependent oxidoreductase [Pseudomaricurvus alkylphenolicus]NIB38096.1 FAD-dependent oxidoreductase [Pseudomaricurvus alkylphenolicus]